jgi:Ca-activated chloride channel homolog
LRNQSLKIDVELALVTATVTDPSGRIVVGLRPEDFQLWEDKVEQQIEYFSQEDVPLSLGLIFDTSGSMSEKLSTARDAAVTFLKPGSPEDEYFLVEFSDTPKVTEDLTTDISRLQNHLIFAQAKGATSLFDAVYMGLEKLSSGTNKKRAFPETTWCWLYGSLHLSLLSNKYPGILLIRAREPEIQWARGRHNYLRSRMDGTPPVCRRLGT